MHTHTPRKHKKNLFYIEGRAALASSLEHVTQKATYLRDIQNSTGRGTEQPALGELGLDWMISRSACQPQLLCDSVKVSEEEEINLKREEQEQQPSREAASTQEEAELPGALRLKGVAKGKQPLEPQA